MRRGAPAPSSLHSVAVICGCEVHAHCTAHSIQACHTDNSIIHCSAHITLLPARPPPPGKRLDTHAGSPRTCEVAFLRESQAPGLDVCVED